MPSLVVPEAGFNLESSRGSSSKAGHVAPDVLGLTLTDGMIEEMIKCVQNGKPIQLSLGEHPSFSYGTKTQHLSASHDPFTYDLYQSTNSSDSDSSDSEMASHFIPRKPPMLLGSISKKHMFIPGKNTSSKPANRTGLPTKTAEAAEGDYALAQLREQNAAEEAKKQGNKIVYLKDGPLPVPPKRGASKPVNNKSKIFSQHNRLVSDTRSMPSSPALNATGSPSLGPTAIPASAQQSEHLKAARKPVIHLLAVQPMTENTLREKLPDFGKDELKQVLEKVGDKVENKWELNKKFFKELDVWAFDYEPISDRQRAIDNAVKQYDKMRIGLSEPEWDRLLVKSERGTGKSLSKLQASIAQGTAGRAPKIKVQKADGSDTPNGEDDNQFGDKNISKVKGENTTRSASQPPATKAKKVSEKEAQAKRLLSNKPNKPVTKPAAKAAPAKKTAPPPPKAGTKVLSTEFVEESDDDAPPPAPKPKPKPKAPLKRSREDEEIDTSDSNAPLSKKAKKDTPVTNHRVSDASQTSRTTNTSNSSYNSSYTSSKNKNTSPHKSSPLASSPPTNASEFENSSGDRTSSSASPAHPSIKNSRSPIHKRHQKSSSVASSVSSSGSSRYLKPDVADLARKFKMYYPKYEALHKEITAMGASGQRNHSKEKDLLEMHARLEDMKKLIQAGIINETDSQSN